MGFCQCKPPFLPENFPISQQGPEGFHQGAREFLDRLHDVFRGIEVHIGVTLGPSVENVVQPRLDKNMDFFNGKWWKNDGKTSGKKKGEEEWWNETNWDFNSATNMFC